ncbi:MAG: TRAP transporter large permease subunit [Neisseriaceae bacterium]|nr:TRAP transporter large permease subunit [Neisseriaceae bacterium]MBP6861017.1 TRAP transporter large permease subunit [Neisseriaceae bacterium]
MNPILLSVLLMVGLSMLRVPVVLALIIAAIIGGLTAGLALPDIALAFNAGLGGGATVALAYATLGAFAVALARTGLTDKLATKLLVALNQKKTHTRKINWLLIALYASVISLGFLSETLIPIHIAFIPIVIPPLLLAMNRLNLDRRAMACAITFSIIVMYMAIPVGFGSIFLNDILIGNINRAGTELGFSVTLNQAMSAMALPALGMLFGLTVALLFSYRKKRHYADNPLTQELGATKPDAVLKPWQVAVIVLGLVLALLTQLYTDSMIFGALVGFSIISTSGLIKRHEQDQVFTQGMRLMAQVGFIMITAAGFAEVMRATGNLPFLVESSVLLIGDSKALAALVMLLVGLFITMGIGSSFSTIPIIAAIYVPLCVAFGFSELATIALIGAAAALGDAGSPASDSTLGPTAGLNADGQHNHIWDTVVPTFIHFNIPLIVFGWAAAMLL